MLFRLRGLAIALLLAVCIPLHYLALAATGRSHWYARFLRGTGRIAGLRVRREGVPLTRDVLFAANHTSWLDIVLLGGATGGSFVSKAEVADWPVIGMLARIGRTVFVARGDRGAVRAQADELAAALSEGRPVILFPEGTTGGGGALLPFRASLFAAVVGRERLRVQPVAIDYGPALGHVLWPRDESAGRNARRLLSRRGTIPVVLRFGPPLEPGTDRKALAARVERAVGEALGRS